MTPSISWLDDSALLIVFNNSLPIEFREMFLIKWDIDALALGRGQLCDSRIVFFCRDDLGEVSHLDRFIVIQQVGDYVSSTACLEEMKGFIFGEFRYPVRFSIARGEVLFVHHFVH